MNDHNTHKGRILLVEDEAIVALSEKKTIEKHGYEVTTAHSGEKAVETATQDTAIDLVLMDIDLGTGIDGTEAAQQILETRSLSIVFLTGHSEKEYVDKVRKITSYGYVLKNSGEFVLIESIRMAYELFEAHHTLRVENQHREQSEKELEAIYANTPVLTVLLDKETNVRRANTATTEFTGSAEEELVGTGFGNALRCIHHLDDPGGCGFGPQCRLCPIRRTVLETFQKTHGYANIEASFKHLNDENLQSTTFLLSTDYIAFEKEPLVIATLEDISDRKQVEEQLRESEEKYRALYENAPLPYQSLDPEGYFIDVNPSWLNTLGYARDEVLGKNFSDFLHPSWKSRFEETFSGLKKQGYCHQVHYQIRHKNGEYRDIVFEGRIGYKSDGTVARTYCVFKDITEQARIEAELYRHKEFLQRITDNISDVVALTDVQGNITYHNTLPPITGYEEGALVGNNALDSVHPDDFGRIRTAFEEFVAYEQGGRRVEYRFRCADGHYIWFETEGTIIRDETGNLTELLFTARDITDREKTREALQENRKQLETIFNSARDAIGIHDFDGNFLEVNNTACERLGYSKSELLNLTIWDIDKSLQGHAVSDITEQLRRGETAYFEGEHITKEGKTFPVDVSLVHIDYYGVPALLGIARDISERKAFEEKLRKSEEHYRFLADNIQDVVLSIDLENDFPTYATPSVETVLGYTPEQALSIPKRDLLTEDSYARQSKVLRDAIEKGKSSPGAFELEAVHKKGHTVPIEVHPTLIRDENGTAATTVTVIRDLTERKRTEAELREERALLQSIVDNIPGGPFVKDRESRFILVSINKLPQLGVDTVDEVIGKTDFDVLPRDYAEEYYADEQRIIATGEPLFDKEEQTLDETGAVRWLLTTKVPFKDDTGKIKGIIGVSHDITENREERDKLRATVKEKQFLMRELNHRVKNNLSLVSSLISLKESALQRETDLSDLRNQVEAIEKVHQSLQQSDDITHINLKSHVADILSSVFHSSTGLQVEIENNIPDISVPTKAAVPLGLIINETATNAHQHGFTGQEECRFTVAMEEDSTGENYILTISNTGRPFPENVVIEDPQGLGLQLVSALVAQLQGTLELQRKPQTMFTIRLPVNWT